MFVPIAPETQRDIPMSDLVEWADIEAAAWSRDNQDHDAHVACRDRFTHTCTVQLCLLFSEQAKTMCDEAMANLDRARARAERSIAYLRRTNDTLEQIVRLQAMGRR